MSNYRGGGYRDRERPGPYRDGYPERDRDWRDRDRDREGRRDPRYDDSRRRYDTHEGLERPLGDPYDRFDDRRRPYNRDFDRPPPRRFERDERDYDRFPSRYGPPPAAAFEDLPRGPRAARRNSRSISPPSGPRYTRDVRPPVDYDRQLPPPRRRSVSPSSQSSSSRRPRSPSRRPVSPAPLERDKFKVSTAVKSPLESGEERVDSPVTGKASSSASTSASGSLTIRGSAAAPGFVAASSKPQDARTVVAQSAPSAAPADKTSSEEVKVSDAPKADSADRLDAPAESTAKVTPAVVQAAKPRENSPPRPLPTGPAVPTGPRALRDGRAPPYQGSYPRGGGGFGRARPKGPYSASSSGMGTYASRPSQRDSRDGQVDDESRWAGDEPRFDSWQDDAGPAQTSTHAGRSADTPQKQETRSTGWGESSNSPWQADKRSSPRDVKQNSWVSSPVPVVNDKEIPSGWGGASPSMKEDVAGHNSPGASSWPRRDSRSSVRGPHETSGSSPGHWGDASTSRSTDRRPFEPKDRWTSSVAAEREATRDPSLRSVPSPAKNFRSNYRPGSRWAEQQPDPEKEAKDKDEELLKAKPWIANYREVQVLRNKRNGELDTTLLKVSAKARRALRELEILEGELTAVNLNRKLRKEHLDKYKETFIGQLAGYSTGDVAMI